MPGEQCHAVIEAVIHLEGLTVEGHVRSGAYMRDKMTRVLAGGLVIQVTPLKWSYCTGNPTRGSYCTGNPT